MMGTGPMYMDRQNRRYIRRMHRDMIRGTHPAARFVPWPALRREAPRIHDEMREWLSAQGFPECFALVYQAEPGEPYALSVAPV